MIRAPHIRANLRSDRGNGPIEAAIGALALFMLISFVVIAGRTTVAANTVADAAADAARTASLARSKTGAQWDAKASADNALSSIAATCRNPQVVTDPSGFDLPVGVPATVKVTVSCDVAFADLLRIPFIPGGITVRKDFVSPLDQYRGRQRS